MNVELYQASVPILGKDEEGVRLETYDVALPHEMFAALYEKKPMFMETFVANCPKHVAEYWQNARGQAWFEGHPHKNRAVTGPETAIPLRLHGDDAPFKKHGSMLIVNMMSVVACYLPPEVSKILMFAVPLQFMIKEDLAELYSIIVWSLGVLATGTWPKPGAYFGLGRKARAGLRSFGSTGANIAFVCRRSAYTVLLGA